MFGFIQRFGRYHSRRKRSEFGKQRVIWWFSKGERASTSQNRDEKETPLFTQDDYKEESDPDYIAPSESEEDRDVSAESDFEESDDELLENEERNLNPLPRRHEWTLVFALKTVKLCNIHHKREYTVAASSPKTCAVRCSTLNAESEDGEPPCEWKMRVSLKDHCLHEIVRCHDAHNGMIPMNDNDNRCVDASLIARLFRKKVEDNVDYTATLARKDVKTLLKVDVPYKRTWHGRRKAIEAVYSDWTSNFEELPRYIVALKFTNSKTVVEWEWKEGQENWNRRNMTFKYVFWSFTIGEQGNSVVDTVGDRPCWLVCTLVWAYERIKRIAPHKKGVDYIFDETAPLVQRWECRYTYGDVPRSSLPPFRDQLTSMRVEYGEVLNNIRVSFELFRDKQDDNNLLDDELEEHLNKIINQAHATLTLGVNDEIAVDDTQILDDEELSIPSQPPPGKKAKPWSRDKIGGGRKRKIVILLGHRKNKMRVNNERARQLFLEARTSRSRLNLKTLVDPRLNLVESRSHNRESYFSPWESPNPNPNRVNNRVQYSRILGGKTGTCMDQINTLRMRLGKEKGKMSPLIYFYI
ncbi:OLC1v1036494C1 [Oldenlandia corymbosa var. corymbosa]|uniref:OLC1v1036494C1 n=1 Tax=Oldenlandia corymbosa var. corymbosa TaxID=529605 RepID=A0AAV1CVD9_OLDCO|nr:OLC1v1036494C1 [Oldenlandia corymbosa var. corymbosa]